jgi:hypothetical protein
MNGSHVAFSKRPTSLLDIVVELFKNILHTRALIEVYERCLLRDEKFGF